MDVVDELGLVRGFADGGGGDEAGLRRRDALGVEDLLEFAEGVDGAMLGGGGDGGGGGVAAEDDGLLEAVEGEEFAGGRVGSDEDELEGVGAHVDGGEEVGGGGGGGRVEGGWDWGRSRHCSWRVLMREKGDFFASTCKLKSAFEVN